MMQNMSSEAMNVRVDGPGVVNPVVPIAEAQPYMFLGLQIEDPEIAVLVKKIVRITMCIIVLAIVNFVMDIILGNVYNILGLIVYLSIAACGYYGAKRRDKQLL